MYQEKRENPISELEKVKSGKNIDRYLYVITRYKIKKQSEFADKYKELFEKELSPSTIAHNFKRYCIKKNDETGIYERVEFADETDQDKLFRILTDNESRLYYYNTLKPNFSIMFIQPDFTQDIAELIYKVFEPIKVSIIVGYGSLLLVGIDGYELKKIMFKMGLSGIPIFYPLEKGE